MVTGLIGNEGMKCDLLPSIAEGHGQLLLSELQFVPKLRAPGGGETCSAPCRALVRRAVGF